LATPQSCRGPWAGPRSGATIVRGLANRNTALAHVQSLKNMRFDGERIAPEDVLSL